MNLRTYGIILLALISFSACNKDKRLSNSLDNGVYRMENLKIDGQSENSYISLEFSGCKIYTELCNGIWKDDNDGQAEFYWQINEKGKEFILSNITSIEAIPPNYPQYLAVQECYNYSGTYSIIDKEKNNGKLILYLQSTTTKGFNGKVVEFTLKQQ